MWPFKKKKQAPILPPIDTSAEMDRLIRERIKNMLDYNGFIHESAVNAALDCMNVVGHLHPHHPKVKKLGEAVLEMTESCMIVETTKPYIRAAMLLNHTDLNWVVAKKSNGQEPTPV